MLASPTSPGTVSPPGSACPGSQYVQSRPKSPESKRTLDAGTAVVATVVVVNDAVPGLAVALHRSVAALPVMSTHVVWLNPALVDEVKGRQALGAGHVLRAAQRVDGL